MIQTRKNYYRLLYYINYAACREVERTFAEYRFANKRGLNLFETRARTKREGRGTREERGERKREREVSC